MYTLNSDTQKAEMQISMSLKTTWSVKQVSTQLGLCSDTCVKRKKFLNFYLLFEYAICAQNVSGSHPLPISSPQLFPESPSHLPPNPCSCFIMFN